MVLAHLVEESDEYANFYKDIFVGGDSEKIMDNSAFEKFKRGEPMYESSKLVDMGRRCGATVIVLSDYPGEHYEKTIQKAIEMAPSIKSSGFKTMYVPQSELGDIDGYLKSLLWAVNNNDIDYIGLSILGCPIALGVKEETFNHGDRDQAFLMQRFLSRWKMLNLVDSVVEDKSKLYKKFHNLGCVDGLNEILLLEKYKDYIKSWDSSSAVWAGINGVRYDGSPTGLRYGKIESEVDFFINEEYNADIEFNVELINNLCQGVK